MAEEIKIPFFSYKRIGEIADPNLFIDFGINAYTTIDHRSIYVDQNLYDRLEPQYRFTLAHELGHIFLHKEIYRKHGIKDLA